MHYVLHCMDSQLTIRLPDELRRALDEASRRTHRRSSDIVRAALREYLGAGLAAERPADRVRSLLGSLESGRPDLAEKHRQHVLESSRRGR